MKRLPIIFLICLIIGLVVACGNTATQPQGDDEQPVSQEQRTENQKNESVESEESTEPTANKTLHIALSLSLNSLDLPFTLGR